jgi:hypothetical protein
MNRRLPTNRRFGRSLLILTLLLGLVSSSRAATVRCSMYENTLLNRLETLCDDGTRATSYWNNILERWETTVQPAPSTRQACTARVNPLTKAVEVQCR